jgi:hypothetical protein
MIKSENFTNDMQHKQYIFEFFLTILVQGLISIVYEKIIC